MKHARKDYDRIQDPANLIPEDEPVFLLRGQDYAAPATVEFWAKRAGDLGAKGGITRAAMRQARRMREWQNKNSGKIPDAPADSFQD